MSSITRLEKRLKGVDRIMNKRKLTPEQKIILEYIPDFFNWHEGCRGQVERMVRKLQSASNDKK